MTGLSDIINSKMNKYAGAMDALAKGEVMNELKPCPFCGESKVHMEKPMNVIYCENCGAEMDTELGDWNTRPIEDKLLAQLAERDALIERLVGAGDGIMKCDPEEWLDNCKTWLALVAECRAMKGGEG